MKKIIEAKVLVADGSININGSIKKFIDLGFQPYGSPCITNSGAFQVSILMVKYEESE